MGIFDKIFGKSREPEKKEATSKDINAKVDALIFKLKDPDPTVKVSSVREMIALGKPAVEPLIQYLQHPDKWARLMAASALGKMKDPRAIEPLSKALNDSDEGVRYMAQTALKELAPERRDKEATNKNINAKVDPPGQWVDELVKLCTEVNTNYDRLPYADAQEAQRQLEVRIRKIGQGLFDQGGKKLMLEIHAQVARRCPYGRYLEGAWGGVGTWRG